MPPGRAERTLPKNSSFIEDARLDQTFPQSRTSTTGVTDVGGSNAGQRHRRAD
jgi:hypothetical protein